MIKEIKEYSRNVGFTTDTKDTHYRIDRESKHIKL